ncbi:hypothetical protein [Variovorax sp. 22077]|uniref:hypothetical protein n=1 Tax=Variovorax sp. 22077 TaxID=3453867 RepID=UPI003F87C638
MRSELVAMNKTWYRTQIRRGNLMASHLQNLLPLLRKIIGGKAMVAAKLCIEHVCTTLLSNGISVVGRCEGVHLRIALKPVHSSARQADPPCGITPSTSRNQAVTCLAVMQQNTRDSVE